MKESILHRVNRCGCGLTYYIGVDGDSDRCDECIANAELADKQAQADDGIGWRNGVKLEGDGDGES